MRLEFALLTIVLGAATGNVVSAQVTDTEVRELTRQLDADAFGQREAATERLRHIGKVAKAELVRCLKHRSLEVRLRAEHLLNQLLRDEFEEELQRFVSAEGTIETHHFPCWSDVAGTIGIDRSSRRLFADMLRHDRALLYACADDARDLAEQFAERIQMLQPFDASGKYQPKTQTPASVGMMVFIGSHEAVRKDHATISQLISVIGLSEAHRELHVGEHATRLRSLLDRFAQSLADSKWQSGGLDAGRYYALQLSLQHQLRETGASTARRVLIWPASDRRILQSALLAIGKYGTREDLDSLRPHLGNRIVCHQFAPLPFQNDAKLQVQIRDLALAVEIHLSGKDPQQFGFRCLKRDALTLFSPQTCGFHNDVDRQAAIRLWRASR